MGFNRRKLEDQHRDRDKADRYLAEDCCFANINPVGCWRP
jgi:hypothetical protein